MARTGMGSIDMTGEAFGVVAGFLSAMPAQQRWDDGVATLYAISLKDVPDQIGIEAVVALVKQVDYRPSPASVLRKVASITNPDVNTSGIWRRINYFITLIHPSLREHKQKYWLILGDLKQCDIDVVEYMGGWNAIGKRTPDENRKLINEWEQSYTPEQYIALPSEERKAIAK